MHLTVRTNLSDGRNRERRRTDFRRLADIFFRECLEALGFGLDFDDGLVDAHVKPQQLSESTLCDFGNLLVNKLVVPSCHAKTCLHDFMEHISPHERWRHVGARTNHV